MASAEERENAGARADGGLRADGGDRAPEARITAPGPGDGARTDAGPGVAAGVSCGAGPGAGAGVPGGAESAAAAAQRAAADTVDLRLPDELLALPGEQERPGTARTPPGPRVPSDAPSFRTPSARNAPSTRSPSVACSACGASDGSARPARPVRRAPFDSELLDGLAGWGPASSGAGVFQLVPVRPDRDLALISRWMNDPAVAAFWDLAGPESVTAGHLRTQLDGDGRSMPCLGVLDGVPMSYFEIYRADLDPLARHYPARPHDTGIHLLLGGARDRGRGLGSALLRAVSDHILDHRPRCTRVLAEPDLRNTPSVSAFLSGGFRFAAEVDLPGKRAALMVRDRALRGAL